MSDLKPCPFCGGEAVRIDIMDNPPNRHVKGFRYFGCRKCAVVSFAGMTEAEAIVAWNTRTYPNARVSFMGDELFINGHGYYTKVVE